MMQVKAYNIELLGSNDSFEILSEDLMKLKVAEGLLLVAYFAVNDDIPGIPILKKYLLLLKYAEAHNLLLSGLLHAGNSDSLLFSARCVSLLSGREFPIKGRPIKLRLNVNVLEGKVSRPINPLLLLRWV
jgi:hypothetical protein